MTSFRFNGYYLETVLCDQFKTGTEPPMIQTFLQKVTSTHKTGAATEHSYDPALHNLLNNRETMLQGMFQQLLMETP